LSFDDQPASESGSSRPKGDVMAGHAKLLWLEAKKIRDPDGADEIVVSRKDGVIFERVRLRKDEVFEFDNRLLPFLPSQVPIEVVLTEVNEAASQGTRIGSVSIAAEEVGLGESTTRIGGAGALYELRYQVI
jgi:hypothetical protein